jgi:hypothetical protein
MSISSILAFVLLGTAPFKGPRDRADEKPTRPSYKELKAELGEARARIAELEGDVHRANIQFRRDQDLIDMWRTRALHAEGPAPIATQPAGPDFRPPHIAQAQAAMQQAQQAQLAQYQGLAQHNAQQNYANGLGAMGLLGAQTLIDAELWCNCVPSRSQVWATSDPE